MTSKAFLEHILPGGGSYIAVSGGQGEAPTYHQVVETQDKLIEKLQEHYSRNQNSFFAISSFNNPWAFDRTANKWRVSRRADKVAKTKVIVFDVDVGQGKKFTTLDEAAKGFVQATAESELPKPQYVVKTGGGLHFYYVLEEALEPGDYEAIGTAAREWARNVLGLGSDASVTGDIARIMRTPGTQNWKLPTPRPVGEPMRFPGTPDGYGHEELLEKFGGGSVPLLAPDPSDNDDLAANVYTNHPRYVKNVVSECGVVRHQLGCGGAKTPNGTPTSGRAWVALLDMCAYAEDGESYARRLSEGHPGFDEDKFQYRWGKALEKAQGDQFGPTTCSFFSQTDLGSICQKCPHFNNPKVKSPLPAFGRGVAAMPANYIIEKGSIYRIKYDPELEEKEYVTVYEGVIENLRLRYQQREDSAYVSFDAGPHKDDLHTVVVPLATFHDRKQTANALLKNKVVAPVAQLNEIGTFILDWATLLSKRASMPTEPMGMGWFRERGGGQSFALGEKLLREDGSELTFHTVDRTISSDIKPKGTLERWKTIAERGTDNPPELQVIMAASFGAPLMEFTPVPAALLSVQSDASGVGKSAMMQLAQSVWGNRRLIGSFYNTDNYMFNCLATLNNLPYFWDEIRMLRQNKVFIKNLFIAAQGAERGRLTRDSTSRGARTWSTLLVAATNEPLVEYLEDMENRSAAGFARMIEVQIKTPPSRKEKVWVGFTDLDRHYGVAGEHYARFLVANQKQVRSDVEAMYSKLSQRYHGDEARFWVATMTCCALGARYAQNLGLFNFDTRGIMRVLMDAVTEQKTVSKEVDSYRSAGTLIKEFLNDNVDHTLKTDIFTTGKLPCTVQQRPERAPLRVHHAVDDGVVRIQRSALRDWATQRGCSVRQAMKEMTAQQAAQDRRAKLGAGTKWATGSIPVVDVRASWLGL